MQQWAQKPQISFEAELQSDIDIFDHCSCFDIFLSYLAHHIHTSRKMPNHHLCVQAGLSSQSQLENSLFPKNKKSAFSYTASRFHQTQRVRLIFLQTKVNDNQPLPDLVEELSKGEISGSTVIEEV